MAIRTSDCGMHHPEQQKLREYMKEQSLTESAVLVVNFLTAAAKPKSQAAKKDDAIAG